MSVSPQEQVKEVVNVMFNAAKWVDPGSDALAIVTSQIY